ncbi:MAG: META domain-containing protein [Coriobacteriia bacterium]
MTRIPLTRLAMSCVACAALAVSLAGCAPAKDNSALLTGRVWRATEVRTAKGLAPVPGTGGPTSEFASDKVTGTTGVNRYNGTYTTKSGDKIEIAVGPMTLMAGPPAAMAIEQSFVEALKSAKSYSVAENTLTLMDGSGNALVNYKVLKETPLVGTKWKCTMYNNGRGGFQGVIETSTSTAVFGEDESLSGNAGVNSYNGTYAADNGEIKIDPALSTTMMAGDPEVMAQETAYLAALPKATVYKIEGSTLTLRDAGGAAMAAYEAE